MKKRLFYPYGSKAAVNLAALILRLALGLLMIPAHGWAKLVHFNEKKIDFVNFMGLGSEFSLGLTVFAEFFCSILLILGLFTRLAVVPLIITMLVILVSVHNWEIFGKNELPAAFLAGYFAILLIGPGKYSVDALISGK